MQSACVLSEHRLSVSMNCGEILKHCMPKVRSLTLKCAGQERSSLPVAASQTYMLPDSPPAATYVPSGELATACMLSAVKHLSSLCSCKSHPAG